MCSSDLDPFKGGGIQSVQRIDLRFSILDSAGGVVNNLTGQVKKLDILGATIECGIVNFQPIHSQNEVYGGRFQEDGGNKEFNSFATVVFGTNMVVQHWPIRVRTIIGGFIISYLKLCENANASDMNECDAPESNKTVAGTELTRRYPSR